jgi:GntR family transcriptional regulator, rspAB operon transcriptional repressor
MAFQPAVPKSEGVAPFQRVDAYERLLQAIVFADLEPGAVVDEKELVAKFGLGIAAVRDALQRLAIEGMVDRRARIGTMIPDLSLRDLHDVFEARVELEGYCASLAAQRARPDQIAAMEEAFVGFEDAIRRRDFRMLVSMDFRFHRTMAASTLNRHIERQVVLLHNQAARFWYFGLPRLDPAALVADIASHLDVVESIKKGDAGAAKRAMGNLLGHFPDNVRSFLSAGINRKEREDE